jgi:hypothetical protein
MSLMHENANAQQQLNDIEFIRNAIAMAVDNDTRYDRNNEESDVYR